MKIICNLYKDCMRFIEYNCNYICTCYIFWKLYDYIRIDLRNFTED